MAAASGGGAIPKDIFLEPQAYSNEKPALALLFSDTREERFSKSLNRLEPALKCCGYNVKRFDGRNIVADFRRELESYGSQLGRLLFVYDGHGCMSANHPKGLLSGNLTTSNLGDFVRVAELEDIADGALNYGVPKVFFLDCCYSEFPDLAGLPPKWHVDPATAHIHNVAFLRASSEGKYGYGGMNGDGLLGFVAESLLRFDKLDLEQLKHSIASSMSSFASGKVEPMLIEGMSKPFTFVRGDAVLPLIKSSCRKLKAGTYTIRLAGAHLGTPAAPHGFLSCHNTVEGDKRGDDSVYVHVNLADYGDAKWRIEDVGGAFTIRLADAQHGAPAAGFLSCHNTVKGDKRGDESVYVHANLRDYGDAKWCIEDVGGAFTIRLADAQHGAPAAGFLSCHNTVEGDKRGDESVYVHVNLKNCGSGTKWTFDACA